MKISIIGSGIAGLAAAIRLKQKGVSVSVFEANSYPGGKICAFSSKGYQFDYGPSLFTMPHFIDELFTLHGIDPKTYFTYHKKSIICNYFWGDGTFFQAPASLNDFIANASNTFGEKQDNLKKYLKNSAAKYHTTSKLFMEKSLHKWSSYLSIDTLKGLINIPKLDLLKSLHRTNSDYLSSPKLIQLFNRYATYNGSNPYKTPGIMSLIPQLEMNFGTYYPKGGMHSISKSLYKLALSLGITFHFEEKVCEIIYQKNRAVKVQTNKNIYNTDIVVCNMDVFSAYQTILSNLPKPKRILQQERSSSALIFYWGIKKKFPRLDLHNIFFSTNYEEEFHAIFDKGLFGKDPTVYVNITAKEESHHAPKGCENWFVMINTAADQGQDWEQLQAKARDKVLKKLSKILKYPLEGLIETETVLTPPKIAKDTISHQGSLYGTSSNTSLSAFLRHPNFSPSLKNLYFCGGSAHPGGGIPLCLLSAKITSNIITKKWFKKGIHPSS